MPVLPLVGSMITVSLLDLAVAFGGVDHGPADAVLDAPQRIRIFELADNGGHAAFGDPVEANSGVLPMQFGAFSRIPLASVVVAMDVLSFENCFLWADCGRSGG